MAVRLPRQSRRQPHDHAPPAGRHPGQPFPGGLDAQHRTTRAGRHRRAGHRFGGHPGRMLGLVVAREQYMRAGSRRPGRHRVLRGEPGLRLGRLHLPDGVADLRHPDEPAVPVPDVPAAVLVRPGQPAHHEHVAEPGRPAGLHRRQHHRHHPPQALPVVRRQAGDQPGCDLLDQPAPRQRGELGGLPARRIPGQREVGDRAQSADGHPEAQARLRPRAGSPRRSSRRSSRCPSTRGTRPAPAPRSATTTRPPRAPRPSATSWTPRPTTSARTPPTRSGRSWTGLEAVPVPQQRIRPVQPEPPVLREEACAVEVRYGAVLRPRRPSSTCCDQAG